MRILIVPDSFKESLSALEVAKAIQTGFSTVFPHAEYQLLPVGDGGEGTVDSVIEALGLSRNCTRVTGPFGQEIQVEYGKKDQLAVFEIAAIVGLATIPIEKRNPLTIRTHGIGQLLVQLARDGVKHVMIGIGGSASHDGGIGMAAGLGVRFFDVDGKEVEAIGDNIGRIVSYSTEEMIEDIHQMTIDLITDVTNPLCGVQGATYVFSGQKGLPPSEWDRVDREMATFFEHVNPQLLTLSGAGAGGGMAAGMVHFAGARIRSGIDFVLDQLHFDQCVQGADLVIVGEGCFDKQSLLGKTPIGVSRRTPSSIPVIAICGSVKDDLPPFPIETIQAAFPIISEVADKERTLQSAQDNLIRTAEQVARILQLGMKMKRDS